MKFKYLLVSTILSIMSLGIAMAQENSGGGSESTIRSVKDAELIVPRPQLKPIKSLDATVANALDTIETNTPGVMLILYEDFTWKYYRDPQTIMSQDIFNENWSSERAVPYTTKLEDIPESIKLWIVDDLGEYRCPYQTKVYSPFGYRHRRRHQGVDLPLKTGDPVYAAFSGKVRLSKYYTGYGNLVIIRHENGLETYYGHLSKRKVEVGDWVDAGQEIGLGGSTGRSTGPHLHFETRYQGFAFDPQWLIDFESGTLRHRLFVLRKRYLNANSKYVPESDDEEDDILLGDERDYAVADSLAAVKKAAEEKAAKEAAAAKYYKVRSGDTLSTIAKRNGTTVNAICRLNPGLTTRTVLKIGRNLRVK